MYRVQVLILDTVLPMNFKIVILSETSTLFLFVSYHQANVIFGGSDEPCALGNLYSIGSVAIEKNGALHAAISELIEPYGVESSRMYINFFDMERANVGWNGKTFAG